MLLLLLSVGVHTYEFVGIQVVWARSGTISSAYKYILALCCTPTLAHSHTQSLHSALHALPAHHCTHTHSLTHTRESRHIVHHCTHSLRDTHSLSLMTLIKVGTALTHCTALTLTLTLTLTAISFHETHSLHTLNSTSRGHTPLVSLGEQPPFAVHQTRIAT